MLTIACLLLAGSGLVIAALALFAVMRSSQISRQEEERERDKK